MKTKKIGLAVAVVLASFSGAALAEGSNFYGAIDVGQAKANDACNVIPAGMSCKDTDTAVRGSLGYQVNPSLGVEVSYADYGAAKASGTVAGTPVSLKIAATGWQVSAVGSLPVAESFALTGKLGAAFTKVEASGTALGITVALGSANTTTLAYGIGARYNISKSIALRAQYEDIGKVGDDATTGKSRVTLFTVGATFGF